MTTLDDLDEIIATGRVPGALSFRLNGNFGAGHHSHTITGGSTCQFGIWQTQIVEAYARAKRAGVEKFGAHVHVGSGVLESKEFLKAAAIVLDMAGRMRRKTGIQFEFIDFGGGLGVPYRPEQSALDLENHFAKLCALFSRKVKQHDLGNPKMMVEPGRFLVCDAEIMLGQVRSAKQMDGKNYARTTISMNDLVRHAMYGSYHHVLVDGKAGKPGRKKYTVTGLICETGDRIATDRILPEMKKGDLVAVLNTGAYGYSMGSEYNSRPRPAMVMVDGSRKRLIARRQSFGELTYLEE